jgi:putative ABC transport system ATP-binding protein
MLFQSSNLLQHLTVAENVRFAQQLAGHRPTTAATAILDDLGIAERARARPSELSGGELARAGLAVALANTPKVLLADEPTGELDHANAVRLIGELRARAQSGTAAIVVTHSQELAEEADRIVALRDGQVVE